MGTVGTTHDRDDVIKVMHTKGVQWWRYVKCDVSESSDKLTKRDSAVPPFFDGLIILVLLLHLYVGFYIRPGALRWGWAGLDIYSAQTHLLTSC